MQAPGAVATEVHVRLNRRTDGHYRAHIATPDGSGSGVFAVPDEDLSLDPVNAWISGRLDIKRSTSRGPRDHAVEVGRLLFRALFNGSLHALYERIARSARGLRLRIEADDLYACTLPWELLYDDVVRHDFLALGTESAVLRTYSPASAGNLLTPAPAPLRILAVTADQHDMLQVEADLELLDRLTTTRSHVQVEKLEHATQAALTGRLRDGAPFDVLHVAGTGVNVGTGRTARQKLALEDPTYPEGDGERMSAKELTAALEGLPDLRLVLLAACHTDEIAAAVSRTVPAVIGFRGEITVEACRAFLAAFYRAAVDGSSVELAVWQARRDLETRFPGRREWASATLYLTGRGPLLHRLDVVGAPAPGEPPEPGAAAVDRTGDLRSRRLSLLRNNLLSLEERLAGLGEAAPEAIRAERDRLAAAVEELS